MTKIRFVVVSMLALLATACAKGKESDETVPADTATMAPAPAPMPMPMDSGMRMDSAAHDSMMRTTTTAQ